MISIKNEKEIELMKESAVALKAALKANLINVIVSDSKTIKFIL